MHPSQSTNTSVAAGEGGREGRPDPFRELPLRCRDWCELGWCHGVSHPAFLEWSCSMPRGPANLRNWDLFSADAGDNRRAMWVRLLTPKHRHRSPVFSRGQCAGATSEWRQEERRRRSSSKSLSSSNNSNNTAARVKQEEQYPDPLLRNHRK